MAKELGFSCLDTGPCTAPSPGAPCKTASRSTTSRSWGYRPYHADIAFGHVEGDPVPRRVFIGDDEVTDAIRTAEIDRAVSLVSAAPAVREALLDQQRRIGNAGDYVVEGRDIGTVVFPDAA